MPKSGTPPSSKPSAPSLRTQLALTIGALAALPVLAVLATVFSLVPEVRGALGLRVLIPSLVALLVSILGGLWLARRLLAPLEELERGVRYLKISRRSIGDLYLPPQKERPPRELMALRQGFEDLLAHLRQSAEERELLVATLAHDLKTPLLASVRALDYLAEASDIGRENRVKLQRQLSEELGRVHHLVENLLAASRIESLKPHPEQVDLRDLAERIKSRFQQKALAKGVALRAQGQGSTVADPDMLERAVENLVENAIRHARSKVMIRVGTGWVEVADDGPGLPGPLEKLTQPFLSQALRGLRAGSAGLGLFIVQRVAEIHHGRLATCKNPLGGACLRIEVNYNPQSVLETIETIW